MNRDCCADCPHRAYLHDDHADPIGRCMTDGCDCGQYVPPGDSQLILLAAPAWRMPGWAYDIEETA